MSPLKLVKSFDRMPDNPDAQWVEKAVRVGIDRKSLAFSVFVCPKFNTGALLSEGVEDYMPTDAFVDDLFLQRILKIKSLLDSLLKFGINPRLHVLIGDNDAEVYMFPFMDVQVDGEVFNWRRQAYLESFRARAKLLFGDLVDVQSLGLLKVVPSESRVVITEDDFRKELTFFTWLFSEKGPYKGKLAFDWETLRKMAELKFRLYGAQGDYLERIGGGILLQTEGPGVWLLRTQMLRCTGANAIPAIYPWIRREELAG